MALSIKSGGPSGLDKLPSKQRLSDATRGIAIAIASLLVLLTVLGVVYTWYVGRQPLPNNDSEIITTSDQKNQISAPKRDINTPVGVSIQDITTPVKPGQKVTMTIHTVPESTCTIDVEYDGVKVKHSGLKTKVADSAGAVVWDWTVAANAPVGTWPVTADCRRGDQSGLVIVDLVIKP